MQIEPQIEQPLIVPISKDRFKLTADYYFRWSSEKGNHVLVIPAGFESDGASIPRPLWSLVGMYPDGLIRAAALVHDFIYQHGGYIPMNNHQLSKSKFIWNSCRLVVTRKQADQLFRHIMELSGIKSWRCTLAYHAVRLFGRGNWNNG